MNETLEGRVPHARGQKGCTADRGAAIQTKHGYQDKRWADAEAAIASVKHGTNIFAMKLFVFVYAPMPGPAIGVVSG